MKYFLSNESGYMSASIWLDFQLYQDVSHPPGHALDQRPQVLSPQSDQFRASWWPPSARRGTDCNVDLFFFHQYLSVFCRPQICNSIVTFFLFRPV